MAPTPLLLTYFIYVVCMQSSIFEIIKPNMATYITELKELRKRVPIPIEEALKHLIMFDGNVDKVQQLYEEESIKTVCQNTNCTEHEAQEELVYFKYDITKSIYYIIEKQYDAQYIPNSKITIAKLNVLKDWIIMFHQEDFYGAVSFEIETIISLFDEIEVLNKVGQHLKITHERKTLFMADTNGDTNNQIYTSKTNELKQDLIYKASERFVTEHMAIIERELERHLRNVKK